MQYSQVWMIDKFNPMLKIMRRNKPVILQFKCMSKPCILWINGTNLNLSKLNCHLFYEIGSEISWRGLKKKLPFKYYTYQVKTGPYLNSLFSNSLNI